MSAKTWYIIAWIEVVGCIAAGAFLTYSYFTNTVEQQGIFVRGLFVVPFGLWWGIRQILAYKRPRAS